MSTAHYSQIYIFIFLSLFTFSKFEDEKILFPSIFTLLNQQHVLIANDGIHFYDSKFENEEKDKFISLKISSKEDIYKTTMAQFSYEDDGYILILVKSKIFFFKNNGTYISSVDLSNLINGDYYSITPYKKQENNIYYIISFKDDINKKIILNHFKFNIKSLLNKIENLKIYNIKIKQTNKSPDNIIGSNCLFVFSPLLKDTILACIYIVSLPFEIHIRTFDPKNNFNEIKNGFHYFIENSSFFKKKASYISALSTNLDNKKIFIYFVYEGCPFWLTFDFEKNVFSNYKKYKNVELDGDYFLNKIFYFKEKHEIVAISKVKNNCQVYIFIFNLEYELKYKGIFNQSIFNNNNFFTIFFNKNKTVIVNDNINIDTNEKNLTIKDIRHLQGEDNENLLGDPKCKTSNNQSSEKNLCTECNTEKGYKAVELKNNSLFGGFYECFNETTKPKNFYYNETIGKYKICYETCETCDGDGTYENNHCLTCANNHIKKPGINGTKNCVVNCVYSYYYTPYGYYKCNNNSNCPEESSFYIKEMNKCTDDCSKEEKYNKLYGGMCLENCPDNTNLKNNVCKVNINSCSKSETEIDLYEFLTSGGVDVNAKNYAKEFGYTEKHVSLFYNSQYSIILYQDTNCITELSINMPKIDFGSCYSKILKNIQKKVIIAIVEKLNSNNNDKKSKISYFFYHPEKGEKLDADTLCKDEEIVIKEDIKAQLDESEVNFEQAIYLTNQSINIFNQLDDFYTDICYHYDSPNGKILPVKERLRIYYPNITLCEDGCLTKGVDLETLESICECKFNNLFSNDIIEENALLKSTLGEITDIISNSNLDVLKCYKDVFNKEYFLNNIGGYIIIIIFIIELIFAIKFLANDMSTIRKYLYNLSEKYINLLEDKTNKVKFNQIKIGVPPKKSEQKAKNRKFSANNLKSGERTPKSDNLLKKKNLNNTSKLLTNKFANDIYSIKSQDTENANKPFNMDEYLKTDFDDMEYDDAVKNDKRSFCEFFIDRLKTKQMIADTFYHKDKIRPISIKLILFLLYIDLYFFLNGLFFSEEYIIELYHLDTEDSFFTFLPRSINRFVYTTMVSLIVAIIIDCIFIEEKRVKRTLIREKDDLLQLRYEIAVITKSIKLRYNIFIFLCFFIALISWYYINCFTNVYKGLKEEWIKSSITIIIIMQILSILITLLETILRAISFECKSEKIYKFRQILS